MKRRIWGMILCLLLSACTPKLSQQEENGNPWNPEWIEIGTQIGVSDSHGDRSLREYNDVQGLDGVYYAAFTWGDAQKIINDSGKEADLFPAQLYLLTQECPESQQAQDAAAQWKAVGETSYELAALGNLGEYTLYRLTARKESPFISGLLALGVHKDIAISVELMCAENIFEDDTQVLADFLNSLHFRAQEG